MTDVRHSLVQALAAATLALLAACSQAQATGSADDPIGPTPDVSHPVAMAKAMGVELLRAPKFDCLAVREDDGPNDEGYQVPGPPFSKDIFPCTRCHNKPDDFNTTVRTLTLQHRDIKLAHGPRQQWCYDGHNPSNRDMLRLAGGGLVPFERSYELCGQCHGEKLRDWRLGIHGRRIGCWNGKKNYKREYVLCVDCHNQHSPKFAPREPLPRPKTPPEIALDQDREEAP